MKIAIFTRSMNYRLYESAMRCVARLPYPHYRLRAKSADGYLRAMLDSDADWAINIDEDAFVTNLDALEEMLKYCIANGVVNCGMPDGGVSPIRAHNPLVTNPFFNIINLSELRKSYSDDVLLTYAEHKKEYELKTPFRIIRYPYNYDYFEPYCNFFVWSSQNFNTLYLDAQVHEDGISTILLNHKGEPFLTHTWYSRFYGIDTEHTERINRIIDGCSKQTRENRIKKFSDEVVNNFWYPVLKKLKRQ